MSISLESVERINALKNGIETVTGESYEDLTAGVQALKNSYGQSGFPYIDTSKMTSFAYFHSEGANAELINKWDTSNAKNLSNMFASCPLGGYVLDLNTSKAENCAYMFSGQYNASNVRFKNKLDMSNCVNCLNMFYFRTMTEFPLENTGKVTIFRNAFNSCQFTEAELDLTSCTDMRSAFQDCSKLETLTLRNAQKMTSRYFEQCFKSCEALTDFDIDVLNIVDNYLDFSDCENLTVQSLVNILNALSDNTGVATTYTVKLGATNLAKLSDEQKQIATNKNISLT